MYLGFTLLVFSPADFIRPYPHTHTHSYTSATEADMPAVLRYLAGCKYFAPTGRWATTSVEKGAGIQ